MESQKRQLLEDAISTHYPNFGSRCQNLGKFSDFSSTSQLTGKGYSPMKADHFPLIAEVQDMDVVRVAVW
jgi:hypothetical protein